jgi:hypothetical protein
MDYKFALWLEYQLLRLYLFVHLSWLVLSLIGILGFNSFNVYYFSLYSDFAIDFMLIEPTTYNFSPFNSLEVLVYALLPTAYAEEPEIDLTSIHSSLVSVQENTTPGGLLIQGLLGNISLQLGDHLPIYLTPKGVEAA